MNRILVLTILSWLACQVQALDVVTTAGNLSSQVTDTGITSLKVTGTMDANDFYFIGDNLRKLTSLDIEGVTILACKTTGFHYWTNEFKADEVPLAAFSAMNLTSIKLPAGTRSIGKAALASCDRLTSVSLPATLDSIADFAFAGCSALTSITLPASVTTVGCGAFMRCTALTRFEVAPSSRLVRLDATALLDCPSLKTIALGKRVKSIGERALAGTGLNNVDLTSSTSLAEIGDWAMVKTPVAAVKLPSSVTLVGDGAFLYDAGLNEIALGGKVTSLNDYLLAGTGLNVPVDLTGVVRLGDYALYNVSRLSVVELPETVTWLGTRSMAGMTGLTGLTSNAVDVPGLGEEVWAGVNQGKVLLEVPAAALDDYKAAEQWKLFLYEASWVKGDVNGDGEVNIADINMLVFIIQGYAFGDDVMQRADVDGNGEINIADINAVLAIIMGGGAHSPAHTPDTDNMLRLDDLSIKPGEERTLNIVLDHAGDYSALQCDITLPQGLTIVGSAVRGQHVKETCNMDDNQTLRTVVYSMKNRYFDEDGKAVMTITVRADAALSSESQIVLNNVVLADNDNVGWHAADYVARVNNTSGVEDLNAMADRVWLEGRVLCIEALNDGVAHLAAINGAVTSLQLAAGVNRFEMGSGFYVVSINGKSYKIAVR